MGIFKSNKDDDGEDNDDLAANFLSRVRRKIEQEGKLFGVELESADGVMSHSIDLYRPIIQSMWRSRKHKLELEATTSPNGWLRAREQSDKKSGSRDVKVLGT